MAEQLEFDPAMFGMKSNHGMLRADKNPSTGANSQGIQAGGAPPSNFGYNQQQQGNRGRGGAGPRGGFNRGRGGNRGVRGGARGGFNAGQRSNEGQPFKRQRFDNDGPGGGSRSFFKPSMLEDPWQHLS